MSSGDEMDAWKTTTRPKPRKKQRTVSPQPSTSKQLSNRKLITEPSHSCPSSSDDIEVIDPPPNLPTSTVRPQRKKGPGKALERRPNGKVPDSQSTSKPESQAKGKALESQTNAKDTHVKPKSVKPAPGDLPFPVPVAEDPSDHSELEHEHDQPPMSPRIHKELERWKAKAKDLEHQRDKLSQQLEELFQVRKTDAEEALSDLTALYESSSKKQESIISALQTQLASQSPFFRTSVPEPNPPSRSTNTHPNSGTSAIPHFLTRATADAEQRKLHDELARMRIELAAKDAVIEERERRITELELSAKDIRVELDAEIARSKQLLARQRQPHTKNFSADADPKHSAAIQFYKDFTNLLVLNIRWEPREGVEDDIVHSCMYTFVATNDENDGWVHTERSISFTLRTYTEPSEENLEMGRRVKYTPLAFDNLNQEHLGFLASGFTFPHKQAVLFLGSLTRQMETAFDNERAGSAADEHEERREEIVNVDDDL
ncbi:hypothetical protein CY34DRAFT_15522 [Suillus luteus UH-Slu-Lm8-n1]|uniref:Monopolin complex subunit Csm1/Pcs1 C-terminal domain-containing protein n=1 Tax=Suillus luteus UH-Slu-Lm8-n1 TaxID=930992 RepID=A0A0D0ATT7_9AGAM|nr:hypothetical protein CY34DRAFT_15522 [Suillus luteus UH-Slu-Lm8-n1]